MIICYDYNRVKENMALKKAHNMQAPKISSAKMFSSGLFLYENKLKK